MKQTRIQKHYNNIVVEDIILVYNCQTVMQLPKINKGVLSMSSKDSLLDKQELINNFATCLLISGQRGVPTRARKSISAFQLRKGSLMGCLVTMRRNKMYALLDRIVSFVLPRLQGQISGRAKPSSISFVGDGTAHVQSPSGWLREKEQRDISFGIKEATFFPEIESLFGLRKSYSQSQVLLEPLKGSPLKGSGNTTSLQGSREEATKTAATSYTFSGVRLLTPPTAEGVSLITGNKAFSTQLFSRSFAMPTYIETLNALQGLNVLFSFCTHRSRSKRRAGVSKCMLGVQNLRNKLDFALEENQDVKQKQLDLIKNHNKGKHKKVSIVATEKQKDLLFLSAFQHPVHCKGLPSARKIV